MKTLLFLCLPGVTALTAHAATFAITPVADALVATGPSGNLSNNNYGGAEALAVSAAGQPQGELQSMLMFNLSGALSTFNSSFGAGNWWLESVSLQLTSTSPNNPMFNTTAAGMIGVSWVWSDAWPEGGGTPNAPAAAGLTYSSLLGTYITMWDQPMGTLAFNGATSGASSWTLNTGFAFFSDLLAGSNVSLRLFGADPAASGVFFSRSAANAADRPSLVLVAVPEPSTAISAGTAGLFLLAVRRRRQRSTR